MTSVRLTHPDKVLFPGDGITKADLAHHYATVAKGMLAQVRDRPVSLQVFPRGIGGPGHFAKQIPDYFPDWVARAEVPKRGGTVTHLLANRPETLTLLAQHNAVTPHVWTSRADRPQHPDRLVVDFDPDDDGGEAAGWADVVAGAHVARERLAEAGLEPFVMTTGSRGAHVVAPLRRELDFEAVGAMAADLAAAVVATDPARFTTEFHKVAREGRLYVDVLRNRYAQTVVAPYAVRARPGAPVATPLEWEELEATGPRGWTLGTIGRRLTETGDPWAGLGAAAASPRPAARRLAAGVE